MDYKQQAAEAAFRLITTGQTIGLGAGSTIAHLVRAIAQDSIIRDTLQVVTSSMDTGGLLEKSGLTIHQPDTFPRLDLYFDGCDQFDRSLNALKSGAGIHTDEKILANLADRFILLGDEDKAVDELKVSVPLCIEMAPHSADGVRSQLSESFPVSSMKLRTDAGSGPLMNNRGNLLLDVYFETMPDLAVLNEIRHWSGIIDHSLFYQLATDAIVAGPAGLRHLKPHR